MNWKICKEKDSKRLINFLLDNEKNAVALINRFYKENQWLKIPDSRKGTIFIHEKENEISAACFFCTNGLVLPVFCRDPADSEIRELLIISTRKRLRIDSIMGIKKFIDPFIKTAGFSGKKYIEYFYMFYESEVTKYKNILSKIDNSEDIKIEIAGTSSCNEIFPLHRAYEIEEVLIDGTRYNAAFSYIQNKKILKNEQVYMLRYRSRIAAKCNSNAKSPNYIQVGGMFTIPEFRNRGFGSMVLSGMIREAERNGKKVCLFVKKSNPAALTLYQKLGFKVTDEYAILYV